jgi:hypothetical protein
VTSTQIIVLGVLYLLALAGAHQAHLWWVSAVESYQLRRRCKSDHNQASDDAQEADDMDYDQGVLPLQERQYPELTKRLRETAVRLAREKGEITADDVHEAYPIPLGVDPRIMGVVFSRKDWRKTGKYVPSRRKVNHGRPVPVWELRQSA